MIVLGLLFNGLRYGFEMEKFAEDTNMRRWAAIGMSTIYKALKDLTHDGAVTAKKEASKKGPKRIAYKLTAKGRKEFRGLIAAAVRSDASVYSDRIAGLVFLPALQKSEALIALAAYDEGIVKADETLAARLKEHEHSTIADAVITYYRDIYRAEKKALEKVKNAIIRGELLR